MNKKLILGSMFSLATLCSCGSRLDPASSSSKEDASLSSSVSSSVNESSTKEATLDKLSFRLNYDQNGYEAMAASKEIEGDVVIPSSYQGLPVTSVASSGFEGCTLITSITLSNNIKSLEYHAFKGCISLTTVYFSKTVSFLQGVIFEGCLRLERIEVDSQNEHYSSLDGVLFNKNQTTLLRCPLNKRGTYRVPDGVTSIASWAFSHCEFLTEITLPDSLLVIDYGAFDHCICLLSILVPERVSFIGDNAFTSCLALSSIDVDDENTHYCSVNGVLYDYYEEILIAFPAGIKGEYDIEPGTIEIARYAFASCTSLTSINIAEGVIAIDEYAFDSCSKLTHVTLPSSLVMIRDSAFVYCGALSSITLPKKLTYLGDGVFEFTTSLSSIDVDEDNLVYASSGGVLYDKKMEKLLYCPQGKEGVYSIPEGVLTISAFAFASCNKLVEVDIPSSVTMIYSYAFNHCKSLLSIVVEEDNPSYSSVDGVLLNKDASNIIHFPPAKSGEYVLPLTVTSITRYAFTCCYQLTSIVFNEGLRTISNDAFSSCTSLVSITLPTTLVSIGRGVFSGCKALSSITYLGSKEQWKEIQLGEDWATEVPAKVIKCSDGEIELTNVSFDDEE